MWKTATGKKPDRVYATLEPSFSERLGCASSLELPIHWHCLIAVLRACQAGEGCICRKTMANTIGNVIWLVNAKISTIESCKCGQAASALDQAFFEAKDLCQSGYIGKNQKSQYLPFKIFNLLDFGNLIKPTTSSNRKAWIIDFLLGQRTSRTFNPNRLSRKLGEFLDYGGGLIVWLGACIY